MCSKKTIILLLLLCISGSAATKNYVYDYINYESSNTLQMCEYSDEYKKWLSLSEDEKRLYIMPTVCKINEDEPILKRFSTNTLYDTATTSNIPTSFDLRNVNGNNYVTSVKDQRFTGTCWAFAAQSAVESNILKNTNEYYDFSEMHMSYYSSTNYFTDGINYDGHTSRTVGDGGNYYVSSSYFTKLKGPILESDFPMENYYNTSYGINKNYFMKQIKTTDIESKTTIADINTINFLELNSCTDSAINTIKEYLMKYGALQASYYSDNYYTNGSYLYYNGPLPSNHAISIVGWDDNISRTKFKSGIQPSKNGAFIIKNSWGNTCYDLDDKILEFKYYFVATNQINSIDSVTDEEVIVVLKNNGYIIDITNNKACVETGDEGYYYISYEDTNICKGIASYNNIDFSIEDNVYYYDVLGMNSAVGYGTNVAYAANKFIKKSNYDELLKEITIGVFSATEYEIYLSKTNNLNDRELLSSGVTPYGGYYTYILDEPILIEDDYSIIVKYKTNNGYPVGAQAKSLTGYENTSLNSNQSFISSNGVSWTDMSTSNEIFIPSIKAYTDDDYDFELQKPIRIYEKKDNFKIPVVLNNISYLDKFNLVIYDSNGNDVTSEFDVDLSNVLSGNYILIDKNFISTEDGIYKVELIYKDIKKSVDIEIIYSDPKIKLKNLAYEPNVIYDDSNKIYDISGGKVKLNYEFLNIDRDRINIKFFDSSNNSYEFDYYSKLVTNFEYELNIIIPENILPDNYTVRFSFFDVVEEEKFNIYEFIEVKDIDIKSYNNILEELRILKNDSIDIDTIISPNNSTLKNVEYEIKDKNIASVTNNKTITGLNTGNTKLILSIGDYVKEIDITVLDIDNNLRTRSISNVENNDKIDNYYGGEFIADFSVQYINGVGPYDVFNENGERFYGNEAFEFVVDLDTNKETVQFKIKYHGTKNRIEPGIYRVEYNYMINDSKNTKLVVEYYIELVPYVSIDSISTFTNEISLNMGDSYNINDLNITLNPDNSTINNYTYEVLDSSIAKLENNIISGLKTGNTTLRIKAENIVKDIQINVIEPKYLNFDESLKLINKDNLYYLRINETNINYYNLLNKINTNYKVSLYNTKNELISELSSTLFTGNMVEINNIKYNIIINGEVNGDGKVNYLDYVYVYNHIYKFKHPDSNKTLLKNPYLLAADAMSDDKIDYLDYVFIYNLIKKKGGKN